MGTFEVDITGGNMYKIAICDDDKNFISVLKKRIAETNAVDTGCIQFYEFYSGEELALYGNPDFDVVFMDMQMGKMNGYETAMELRKNNNKFILVFCSGIVMPIPQFFRANVFRYLDKNISEAECREELDAILKEMELRNVNPFIMCNINAGKEQIRVYPEDVLYITIRYKGCRIYPNKRILKESAEDVLRISMNLKEVERIFDESCGFVRIHNSYIVNMAYIKEVSETYIKLLDDTQLNVARSKMKEFRQKFTGYMASKYEG